MAIGKKAKTVIGLDIGSSSIKLVKLEEKGGSYVLSAMGIRELPAEAIVDEEIRDREAVIFNIQNLLDQVAPRAKEVAISISGHGVITDRFTLDKKTGTEAEQAILFEAEQRSPFDVEDVAMDFQVINLNEETNKMDVLLVAARKDFLKSYIDLLVDAGLKPIFVDSDALAIYNAYIINYDIDPSRVTVLVNVGFDTTNVTFIKDGVYHSNRDLSNGGRTIFEAVMKEFRISPELALKTLKGEMGSSLDQEMLKATVITACEELVSALEVAFSYFKTAAKIPKVEWIVMSGGGALIPFLPEFMQSRLNIPVEIANPLRNVEYDPDIFGELQPEKIAPLLAVSVGLASRKVK